MDIQNRVNNERNCDLSLNQLEQFTIYLKFEYIEDRYSKSYQDVISQFETKKCYNNRGNYNDKI